MEMLPSYYGGVSKTGGGVSREAVLHTIFPSRPRIEIIKYQVQKGDTLFGIADKFSLKPETILWGNWYTLGGDPHTIRPGQELNILPVDGVLHQWSPGEGLNGVAKFYGVTAEAIINWLGNDLPPDVNPADPGIEEGSELVVPGGRRDPPSWQMVRITRSNPAVAKILGPGYCGAVSSGLIGDGVFGWPTSSNWISGYHYVPGIHEAIDIGGSVGVGIVASDDGVVVYSGWNDWGYGYVIVLDHGNGWQTLYAHLSQINLGCGASVSQGQLIGLMGCTGNCSGPHVHFEMRNDVWGRVNPLNFLP
jgi:murein DD-endopeptidase MepM/ murein hydrolase activator NlpD